MNLENSDNENLKYIMSNNIINLNKCTQRTRKIIKSLETGTTKVQFDFVINDNNASEIVRR